MSRSGLVIGIPKLPHLHATCSVCISAKKTRERIHKHSTHRATCPFELVHTDIWGPARVPSLAGNWYILTVTDDYTHYTWIFFLRAKSQVSSQLHAFRATMHSQFVAETGTIRSDRGGEYLSHEFILFCKRLGIHRQLTAAHTPHQNGVSERKIRTLLECGRSLCFEARLPACLWEEMV